MARKKISTTVYVEPEQDVALKKLRDRTGIPMAVLIRDAIDTMLRRWEIDHDVLDHVDQVIADKRQEAEDDARYPDVLVEELDILASHCRQVEMERDQCRNLVQHYRGQLRAVQAGLGELLTTSPSFYLAQDPEPEER
jgi:predicted DNA-binding protein